MSLLIATTVFAVIFMGVLVKTLFKKEASIKLNMMSATDLMVRYHIRNESGVLTINRSYSRGCLEISITPTIEGWRLNIPHHASYDDLISFLKKPHDHFKVKNTHPIGFNLIGFMFFTNNDLGIPDNDLPDFLSQRHVNFSYIRNLFSALPDVNFQPSYVRKDYTKRWFKNEQPKSA